jgi:hypothetical protein
MKILNSRPHPRVILIALALVLFVFIHPVATAAPGNEPGSSSAVGAHLQSLTLADGEKIEAAIVAYSLQSRTISLKLANGQVGHIAPRDLTAMSKLKWLMSPAFVKAVKNYQPPGNAPFTVAKVLIGPGIACLLGVFIAFWISVSVISSHKRIGRAAGTYLHSVVFAFAVAVATALVAFGVAKGLGNSPIAPMIHSAVVLSGVFTVISRISCVIADDYSISGASGLGTVMLTLGAGFVLAASSLYLLPRFMEWPGIDDWFTDRLLAPLGLA